MRAKKTMDGNTAAADDAAEHVRQLFGQLDAALDVLGDKCR